MTPSPVGTILEVARERVGAGSALDGVVLPEDEVRSS